jgi:lipopolysaccharide transport system permease protein
VIEPPRGFALPSVRELWAYRDLAYFLARRDLSIRYKQTAIGVTWAVLQPVVLAVVFTVFLGNLADVPAPAGIPYPLFALSGLGIWILFTAGVQASAASTVGSQELITKAYFPRILIPLAALAPSTIDFLVALVVLVTAMFIYGHPPDAHLLLVPAPFLIVMVLTSGVGLLLSALSVRYRDIQILVPFLILIGLFITPVTYPFSLVPDGLQPIYALNPMVGTLELFRYCLFGEFGGPAWTVAMSCGIAVVVFGVGLRYFHRAERTFADFV